MPKPIAPHERAARQRNAKVAGAAFDASFPTPEAKAAYYSHLGTLANARRLVLSADDTDALLAAYELLSSIAERARSKRAKLAASNGHADDDPEDDVS